MFSERTGSGDYWLVEAWDNLPFCSPCNLGLTEGVVMTHIYIQASGLPDMVSNAECMGTKICVKFHCVEGVKKKLQTWIFMYPAYMQVVITTQSKNRLCISSSVVPEISYYINISQQLHCKSTQGARSVQLNLITVDFLFKKHFLLKQEKKLKIM